MKTIKKIETLFMCDSCRASHECDTDIEKCQLCGKEICPSCKSEDIDESACFNFLSDECIYNICVGCRIQVENMFKSVCDQFVEWLKRKKATRDVGIQDNKGLEK